MTVLAWLSRRLPWVDARHPRYPLALLLVVAAVTPVAVLVAR